MTVPKLTSQIPRFVNLKVHYCFFKQFLAYNTSKQGTPQGLDSSWIEELHTRCLCAQNYTQCEWHIIELMHGYVSSI